MASGSISMSVVSGSSVWVDTSTSCLNKACVCVSLIAAKMRTISYYAWVMSSMQLIARSEWNHGARQGDQIRK